LTFASGGYCKPGFCLLFDANTSRPGFTYPAQPQRVAEGRAANPRLRPALYSRHAACDGTSPRAGKYSIMRGENPLYIAGAQFVRHQPINEFLVRFSLTARTGITNNCNVRSSAETTTHPVGVLAEVPSVVGGRAYRQRRSFMQHRLLSRLIATRRMTRTLVLLSLALLLLAPAVFGQQKYVTQYDFFSGYANLYSPRISLLENGYQMQIGFRPKTWYSVGFDYSISSGDLTLTPGLLPTALQQALGAQLGALAAAGRLPAGYQLTVPASSTTQSFAFGPQLAYRHFSKITLFVRPSMGAIREVATPKPTDPIAAAIVAGLAPTGKKADWQGFYGVGYGFDILLTNHFAIRTQGDLVWDHLFNDILAQGRWTSRFSIGPCINFGKNIAQKP